ncbi:MAG: type VI secretion system lipoprotein TssJ [Sterolibacteriaceae bacterium]|uniref:Type VI secretion system lipoprotein TssJ n=1 Tax=Candidatus Methylophosphatis roskildensis TaxID=2899263 RepID=A0A9D7E366_9PROT|nr:type VI secretion system lipoprotein TssJ [Candidatus Methylophosphatis roskildensis]
MAERSYVARRCVRLLLVLASLSAAAGCSSAPKVPFFSPKPTIITATIDAAATVNPDANGRPSPIVMRMFELRSIAAFNNADFFSLWDREREVLSAEMTARDEFQLRPGDQKKFERTLQPETRYVGVIAAFRDLDRAGWRATAPIIVNQNQPINIRLDARSVSVAGK